MTAFERIREVDMAADEEAWRERVDGRLERMDGRLERVESDVAVLKTDVAVLKNDVRWIRRLGGGLFALQLATVGLCAAMLRLLAEVVERL